MNPSKKVLFSLPEKLLHEIDAVAAEEHRSRSELIREATRHYITERPGQGQRPIDDPKVRQAVEQMEQIANKFTEGFDSTAVIRRMTDSRYGPARKPDK